MSSYDYNDPAYDEAVRQSQIDDRIGNHDFMVTEVDHDSWPSGDPRVKIKGVLLTAGSAKTDLTLSPPPPPEVMQREYNSWEMKKKKAVGNAILIYRKLREFYGKTAEEVAVNDVMRVKTAKNREGYIKIVAILPKGATTDAAAVSISDVPF